MNHPYLLSLLKRSGSIIRLKQIHGKSITAGLLNNQQVSSKLLQSYAGLGHELEARKIFHNIQEPDIVSWTCLLNLYIHHGNPSKALHIFSLLIRTGLRPDSYSVVGALTACGRNKDLLSGKIVHGMVFIYQLGLNSITGNALIDMYSRNGEIGTAKTVFQKMGSKDVASWNSLLNGYIMSDDLRSARSMFDEMPERNIISWNAMISGYVRGKHPIQGLLLFREMKREEKIHYLSAITIVSVLSACADLGALDFGQSIHGCIEKFNMNENTTVNNALIGMYSKTGNLEMGTEIFNRMSKKDVFSWTSMISGYAIHGEGSYAIKALSQMMESGTIPNDVTFLSVLTACAHAGLVHEGERLFNGMIQRYGFEPSVEHYGCLVDLLGRAGLLDKAENLIEEMGVDPDVVIWRTLLSACLLHGNLSLAKKVGNKIMELDPNDDGVYVLLWNAYFGLNRVDDAVKIKKLMKNRNVTKKPGFSWVEVNGVVHEFLAEDVMHYACADMYVCLQGIKEQSKLDVVGFSFETE